MHDTISCIYLSIGDTINCIFVNIAPPLNITAGGSVTAKNIEDPHDAGLSLKEFLLSVHKRIENKDSRRITRPEMAARIGSTKRTYTEYLLGTVKPHPMRVLLQLLAQMDDEDIVGAVRWWASEHPMNAPESFEEQDTE